MSVSAVQQAEATLLLPTYDRHPVLFTHGRGVFLYDAQGREYLDFLSGIGVNALGHAHPAVTGAITAQAAKVIHISNLFYHEYQAKLADELAKISGLERAFFTNSGTEAIEGALKLSRAYAKHTSNGKEPKFRILALDNSFHGRTYGALSITGQKKYREPFEPNLPGVEFVTFNEVADLRSKFDETVCAVVLEAIQGEGGIRILSGEFLKAARELTDKAGALLIADEIQCGLGRTGKWFAYQHHGIKPDIVCIAKPLAAGLPLGAVLTSNKVSGCFHPGMHGTTFGGGALTCAVAVTVLETIAKQNLLSHATELGTYFREKLEGLKRTHEFIKEVRGVGLMVGAELDSADRAKEVVSAALSQGLIINRTNNTVLRFLPPFIIQREHVDRAVMVLNEIFSRMETPANAS